MLITPPFLLRDLTCLTRIQVIFWDKISHSLTKKSHKCQEGGAHLRISFGHLLMNFEKPKNQTLKKMKKIAGDIILHMCTKNHNQEVRSEVRQIFLLFWAIFCTFNPLSPNNPESQNLKKMKKKSGDFIILNLCKKNTIIWYMHTQIWSARTDKNCSHFRLFFFFCSFAPLLTPKIKIWKKCKKKTKT